MNPANRLELTYVWFISPDQAKYDCIDPEHPYDVSRSASNAAHLWAKTNDHGSSIQVSREVWLNLSNWYKGTHNTGLQCPVFFVYDYADSSKSYSDWAGCKVNKEPILDFEEALALVWDLLQDTLHSGKWVHLDPTGIGMEQIGIATIPLD